MEEFARSYPEDYANICEDFYIKCLAIDYQKLTQKKFEELKQITIKLPISLVEVFEEKTNKNIQETVDNSKFSSKVLWRYDKCRFSRELFQDLFNAPCSEIIALVKNVLLKSEIKGTKNIIMIGKLAEFPIFETIFKQAFQEIKVIIPPLPRCASLQGAVIYGHEQRNIPKYASSRVEKFIETFKISSCVRVK